MLLLGFKNIHLFVFIKLLNYDTLSDSAAAICAPIMLNGNHVELARLSSFL